MKEAIQSLVDQLKKELAATEEALAFWRRQSPSGLLPRAGVIDLSVNRVRDLTEDAEATKRAIERLLRADA